MKIRGVECNSPEGITICLIDSLIALSKIIVDRDLSSPEIQETLKDLQETDNMKRLMNIGDLESARACIKDQKKTISALTNAIELLNSIIEK